MEKEKMTGRITTINRNWLCRHGAPEIADIKISKRSWTTGYGREPQYQDTEYSAQITIGMAKSVKLGDFITVEIRPATEEEEMALISEEQEHDPQSRIED